QARLLSVPVRAARRRRPGRACDPAVGDRADRQRLVPRSSQDAGAGGARVSVVSDAGPHSGTRFSATQRRRGADTPTGIDRDGTRRSRLSCQGRAAVGRSIAGNVSAGPAVRAGAGARRSGRPVHLRHGAPAGAQARARGGVTALAETWLVLGASSAIARAFARVAAAEGADIILAGRDRDDLDLTASDIAIRTRRRVVVFDFDATDFDSHPALMARAREEAGS